MKRSSSSTIDGSGLSRRRFVGLTGTAAAGILLNAHRAALQAAETSSGTESGILKGFIISDCHFGWNDPQQPSVGEQRQAMAHLMERFPDLDVFIDTGDAHHGDATAKDRGHWTDVVPGGCGTLPFYFLAGNHDLTAWDYNWSPELDIMRVASMGCRPYFSFDVKNIHFLALPELMTMCSVTEEALEWARLDLELNREKTVIVLSHNSLLGTDNPPKDKVYRVVHNSADVYQLLDSAPNVIAWMHGHNHDYNLVVKDNRLYVSNGRFGGFIPTYSTNNASNELHAPCGGMYFEVHPGKFLVRSYSVADGKFLDEMPGGATLSQSLAVNTGLNSKATPVYSFGAGLVPPSARLPVYAYHAPNSGKLFLRSASIGSINQNPDFTQYAVRRIDPKHPERMLIGYACIPDVDKATAADIGFRWDNPGVTILPCDTGSAPLIFGTPGHAQGKRGYYPMAPGSRVKLNVSFGNITPGVEVTPVLRTATSDTVKRGKVEGPSVVLTTGISELNHVFVVPPCDTPNIYDEPKSDLSVTAWVDLEFRNITGPVELKSLHLTVHPEGQANATPALMVDGVLLGAGNSPEAVTDIVALDLPASNATLSVMENASSQPLNWLVQIAPIWQSRNAPIKQKGNTLKLGKRTNSLTRKKDIVLAPMVPVTTPFVHKLSGIAPAKVKLYDETSRRLAVVARTIDGAGLIEISTATELKKVTGAEVLSHSDGLLVARISQAGTAEFYF